MEAATDLLLYLWSETNYRKRTKCRAGTWFTPLVINWMEADRLNVSLQSHARKGWGLCRLNWSSGHTSPERSLSLIGRSSYDILIKMTSIKKKNVTMKHAWVNCSPLDIFRK